MVVSQVLIMASIWGSQVSFFLDIFLIELRNLLHHASLKRQHATLQSNLLCVNFIKNNRYTSLKLPVDQSIVKVESMKGLTFLEIQ